MNLTSVHMKLHDWYQQSGRRDLPWRNTDQPYHIYLSEVMLQQTQVKTVLERYYFPFLERFATIEQLAKADVEEVLKAWQGLGYYTRARNLHKCATEVMALGGSLPDSVEALESLTGIGKNTAHAIACFAFKRDVPIMEANVKRIICRVFAISDPSNKLLWEHAEQLLDKRNSFDYNQAMMDVGSMVCTRTKPLCLMCPFNEICAGKESPQEFPRKKQKRAKPVRKKHILVHQQSEKYWLAPRKSRFLGGLYSFDEHDAGEVATKGLCRLGEVRQEYSHFTLEAEIFISAELSLREEGEWYSLREIASLPLSGADEKIVTLLRGTTNTA